MSRPDSADPREIVGPTPDEEETTGVTGPPVDAASVHGAKVGRFVVLGDLGAGGMGRVMRAFDPELGREVALKRPRGGPSRVMADARWHGRVNALARVLVAASGFSVPRRRSTAR